MRCDRVWLSKMTMESRCKGAVVEKIRGLLSGCSRGLGKADS